MEKRLQEEQLAPIPAPPRPHVACSSRVNTPYNSLRAGVHAIVRVGVVTCALISMLGTYSYAPFEEYRTKVFDQWARVVFHCAPMAMWHLSRGDVETHGSMQGWTKICVELCTPDYPDQSAEEEWREPTFRSWWYYYAFGSIIRCWGRHLRQVMIFRFGTRMCVRVCVI